MLAAGRWHSKGHPIVYFAPDPSTALLEVLVHTGEFAIDDTPITYTYLKIQAPDDIAETISVQDLSIDWQNNVTITRRIGDQWLTSVRSALLSVPSVIVPETMNVLLNPRHADSSKLRILSVISYPLDERLHS